MQEKQVAKASQVMADFRGVVHSAMELFGYEMVTRSCIPAVGQDFERFIDGLIHEFYERSKILSELIGDGLLDRKEAQIMVATWTHLPYLKELCYTQDTIF